METGRLSDALSAAENKNKVAMPTPEVIGELRAKHPPADPPRHQQPLQPRVPLPDGPDKDDIADCLKSFKKDSSPGLSGWTVNLLTLACKDDRFTQFLVRLSGMMLDNTAPGKQYLLAARLTPLRKPDGGVRPIAVGDLLYRLCAKALLRKIFKKEHLAPFQLGVHSPGGVEPIIHGVQGALDNSYPHRYTHYVSIDQKNSYNNHSRHEQSDGVYEFAPEAWLLYQWAYGDPTLLIVRTEDGTAEIESAQGSRQGCPLGGYFYCVGTRRDMQAVVDALGPDHLTMGFVDDYGFLAPNDKVVETVKRVLQERNSSLVLNEAKCHTKSLDDIRQEGFELLGSVVGPPVTTGSVVTHPRLYVPETASLGKTRVIVTLLWCSGLLCSAIAIW